MGQPGSVINLLWASDFESFRKFKLRLQFIIRASSDTKELFEFSNFEPSMPFGNITGN